MPVRQALSLSSACSSCLSPTWLSRTGCRHLRQVLLPAMLPKKHHTESYHAVMTLSTQPASELLKYNRCMRCSCRPAGTPRFARCELGLLVARFDSGAVQEECWQWRFGLQRWSRRAPGSALPASPPTSPSPSSLHPVCRCAKNWPVHLSGWLPMCSNIPFMPTACCNLPWHR